MLSNKIKTLRFSTHISLNKSYFKNNKQLSFQNLPLEIALENINTREERQEFDVVKDEVEAQLNNEVQLIENIKVSINPEYFSFQIKPNTNISIILVNRQEQFLKILTFELVFGQQKIDIHLKFKLIKILFHHLKKCPPPGKRSL